VATVAKSRSRSKAASTADRGAPRPVTLLNLSGTQRDRIVGALGDRITDRFASSESLEIPGVMHDVSWEQYEALLDALGNRGLRHSYDRGTLELMSPRRDHESPKHLIARLVEAAAFELQIPIAGVGSMTVRKRVKRRGFEPDESYYITNEAKVRGKESYDPDVDPPPDLVIEVDVTRSSVPRLGLFAAAGVPEVWRYHRRKVQFFRLARNGRYREVRRSREIPLLAPEDIERFVNKQGTTDETTLTWEFVRWIRSKVRQSE
jgi:Uma2 family endonuclease